MVISAKLCFVLFMLSIFLAACDEHNRHVNINSQDGVNHFQCIKQQNQCYFDIAGGRVEVLFNVDKIIAEQVFTMSVNYFGENTIVAVSGYLEGIDMYMGKIPLFIKPKSYQGKIHAVNASVELSSDTYNELINNVPAQVFRGEILVGSCSAKKMDWQMWLTFTTSDNNTYSKILTITSYNR